MSFRNTFASMPLPTIAPPLGMTNKDLIKFVFEGPNWCRQAASAFGVSERHVWRLCVGRLTVRHYRVMDRALEVREKDTPLMVSTDIRRARERGRKRIERARERRAKYITPVLARLRATA